MNLSYKEKRPFPCYSARDIYACSTNPPLSYRTPRDCRVLTSSGVSSAQLSRARFFTSSGVSSAQFVPCALLHEFRSSSAQFVPRARTPRAPEFRRAVCPERASSVQFFRVQHLHIISRCSLPSSLDSTDQ